MAVDLTGLATMSADEVRTLYVKARDELDKASEYIIKDHWDQVGFGAGAIDAAPAAPESAPAAEPVAEPVVEAAPDSEAAAE